jgi:hypothetical protein
MPVTKITMKEIQQRLNHVVAWQHRAVNGFNGPAPKDVFLYDNVLQGFGCKVTSGGKVSWFVEKRFGGSKNIRKKIGAYPAMNIDMARQQGQIVLGQIARGGCIKRETR